jgi:hypothetical protein
MKKTILLLLLLLSVSLFSQETKEFYGKLNYAFVPHNMLNGAGYTIGYEWNTQSPVSYKIETGMLTVNRVREINETMGEIRLKDLYYNLAQMNVAMIPTWNFIRANRIQLSTGLGFSCAYQSRIFTLSHYEYARNLEHNLWNTEMTVDAGSALYLGAIAVVDLKYQYSEHWHVNLSAQYHHYLNAKSVITVAIGIGYRF